VETIYSKGSIHTSLDNADRELLGRIVRCFGQLVGLEPLGRYRAMTLDDVWLAIVSVSQLPGVFQGHDLVLFEGLSHEGNPIQTRGEIIKRCPIFHLKSASDFMINVGLSHDVIALDTRVVGILQKYLGYNLTPQHIQSHRGLYLSLEAALREFCREQNISLALLDRLLFRFSNLGAIELVVRYPELIRSNQGATHCHCEH